MKIFNTAFPFLDFLYLLQLEEYESYRYLKRLRRFILRRNFQKRQKLVLTLRAKRTLLLSALIIVFFANAFNITDGLDGLSSGLLVIYLFAYISIAVNQLDTPIFIFLSVWVGSIIAFLYFNVPPARIFLGDAGALSFGAMIAVIGLIIGNVATLFIVGGLFVLEAMSSLVQLFGWKYLKRPLLPLAPLHHTLEALGWEEPKIVMRAWLAGIMLAIFGLWLATI